MFAEVTVSYVDEEPAQVDCLNWFAGFALFRRLPSQIIFTGGSKMWKLKYNSDLKGVFLLILIFCHTYTASLGMFILGMAKVSKNEVSGSANKPDEPEDSVTDSFFLLFSPHDVTENIYPYIVISNKKSHPPAVHMSSQRGDASLKKAGQKSERSPNNLILNSEWHKDAHARRGEG